MSIGRWEYMITLYQSEDWEELQIRLDGYGRGGWELVAVTNDDTMIFKRPYKATWDFERDALKLFVDSPELPNIPEGEVFHK